MERKRGVLEKERRISLKKERCCLKKRFFLIKRKNREKNLDSEGRKRTTIQNAVKQPLGYLK